MVWLILKSNKNFSQGDKRSNRNKKIIYKIIQVNNIIDKNSSKKKIENSTINNKSSLFIIIHHYQ